MITFLPLLQIKGYFHNSILASILATSTSVLVNKGDYRKINKTDPF